MFIKISIKNSLRKFISAVLFFCFTGINFEGSGQITNNRNLFIEDLKTYYNTNFQFIDLDTFLLKQQKITGLTRGIDRFAMFQTVFYTYNNDYIRLSNLTSGTDLIADIKAHLPSDYYSKLLQSKFRNTQLLYLYLASITSDSLKIKNYIDRLISRETEQEAKAFLNSLFGYSKAFYSGEITSFFLNSRSPNFFDYSIEYLTPEVEQNINPSYETDGLSAGHAVDFFIYYKDFFLKIDSQEKFEQEYHKSKDVFFKSLIIDIGLSKKYNFKNLLQELIEEHSIAAEIILPVLTNAINGDVKNEFFLQKYFSKVLMQSSLDRDISSRERGNINPPYITLVKQLCENQHIQLYKKWIDSLQLNKQYDFFLFKSLINNNIYSNKVFLNRHFKEIYKLGDDFLSNRQYIELPDYSRSQKHIQTFNARIFFPKRNGVLYYEVDTGLLFEKLISVPEYFSLVEDLVLSTQGFKKTQGRLSVNQINLLINSNNPFNMAVGYFNILNNTSRKFPQKVINSNGNFNYELLFYYRKIFNKQKSNPSFIRHFDRLLSSNFPKRLCQLSDKQSGIKVLNSYISSFEDVKPKQFMSVILKMISDTQCCTEIRFFLLEKYSQYFLLNNLIKKETKTMSFLLEGLCSRLRNRKWSETFSYLSKTDINSILYCYIE